MPSLPHWDVIVTWSIGSHRKLCSGQLSHQSLLPTTPPRDLSLRQMKNKMAAQGWKDTLFLLYRIYNQCCRFSDDFHAPARLPIIPLPSMQLGIGPYSSAWFPQFSYWPLKWGFPVSVPYRCGCNSVSLILPKLRKCWFFVFSWMEFFFCLKLFCPIYLQKTMLQGLQVCAGPVYSWR